MSDATATSTSLDVLLNMPSLAKIAGMVWLVVGIIVLIGFKLSGKRASLPA